ncbi:FGGY family carbohydrate kinase [Alteribacillus sp. JSM 102045]|uniref:FGGY family carbohydrate kinase n=1 Tax=Alteribacillus sp. JSM 102045 TaxID=1562101 RepID=UPI0035BF04A7
MDEEKRRKTGIGIFSAKDYLIYKLTGSLVTDCVTGATTGMMNIQSRNWHPGLLESIECAEFSLPALLEPNELAGYMNEENSGFKDQTPVLCGAGDAGASTLGARAVCEGDSYFYIGTTGWTAVLTKKNTPSSPGVFTLAHVIKGMNISIAPLLNVGNVYEWTKKIFLNNGSYKGV